jgi:hypothetical protein
LLVVEILDAEALVLEVLSALEQEVEERALLVRET